MSKGLQRPSKKKDIYTSCKNFDLECFNIALNATFDSIKSPTYNEFDEAFYSVLYKRAPLKGKRHNNGTFKKKKKV